MNWNRDEADNAGLRGFFLLLSHVTRDRNADEADNADFHGFYSFRLFDKRYVSDVLRTSDTCKNCKTFDTKKIRENPRYPLHPRS